jgi:hypothetical protein
MATPEMARMNHSTRRSIVSNQWKLNLCIGDQNEIFDLNTVPHEEVNLFDDPGHKDRIRDLTARIRMWQHRTHDPAPLPNV